MKEHVGLKFNVYKDELYQILLSENAEKGFDVFVEKLKNSDQAPETIYDVFLNFHRDIQQDMRTQDNETLYDLLSDFMDNLIC